MGSGEMQGKRYTNTAPHYGYMIDLDWNFFNSKATREDGWTLPARRSPILRLPHFG